MCQRQTVVLVVLFVVVLITTVGAGQGGDAAEQARLLAGAIDIHVHSHPDNRPRSLDALDAARQAKAHGMRAIVLKNHDDPTGGLASLVQNAIPGIEVFGGIALNRSVGGINPAAVEHMVSLAGGRGRVVWMPTFDSENGVRRAEENRPFVPVARGGELLPEVRDVIALIAKHDLVLATGHSSPAEAMLLLREGRRAGVKHMVVTHAMFTPVLMTVPQMKEAAALGAFLEFAGGSPGGNGGQERMKSFADAIRGIGVESCILSTDLGQAGNPLPADGFAALLIALRRLGFSAQELDRMAKQNPAALLGLSPR
jgi:hypothetical protein